MSYQIRKVDNNQRKIVETLRKCGMTVYVTSSLGNGMPDLLASYKINGIGRTYLIEIKNGDLPPNKQRLTELEKKFHESWQDHVFIINSEQSALDFFDDILGKKILKTEAGVYGY
jgi:hypothetical protein